MKCEYRFLKSSAPLTFAAALLAGAAGANATPLTFVPAGLNVGDEYRLVFVTGQAAGTPATSTDIESYNALMNADAPSVPGGATWKVIGSTATVSALTNIGGVSNIPIYDLNGRLVADGTFGTHGLFNSGAISLYTGIEITPEDSRWNNSAVFTGTKGDGSIDTGFELGNATHVIYGASGATDVNYLDLARFPNGASPSSTFDYYAISAVRVVTGTGQSAEVAVPEPFSLALLSGGVIGLAAVRRRARA